VFISDSVHEKKKRSWQLPFVNPQDFSDLSFSFTPHVIESVKETLMFCEMYLTQRLGFSQQDCDAFFDAYEGENRFAVPLFAIRVGGVPVDTQGEATLECDEELLLQVCQDDDVWASLVVTRAVTGVLRIQGFAQRWDLLLLRSRGETSERSDLHCIRLATLCYHCH
jgi:hypothetical protein